MGDARTPGPQLDLADRLQARLTDLGLTQTELARRSEVSLSYISRLVRGEIRNPTVDVVRKLAEGLEVTLDELVGGATLPLPAQRLPVAERDEQIADALPVLGRPVSDPRLFFGHEALIRSMRRLWLGRTMQHALVCGPPQAGKTSVLLSLKNAHLLSPDQWQNSWQARALDGPDRQRAAAQHASLWTDPQQPLHCVYATFADPQLTLSEPIELISEILAQLGLSADHLPEDDGSDNKPLLVEFVKRVRTLRDKRIVCLFDDVDRMVAGLADAPARPAEYPQRSGESRLMGERFSQFAPLFLRACRTLGADDRVPLAFVMTYTLNLDSTIDLQKDASSPFFGLVCHKFSLGPLEYQAASDLARVLLTPVAAVDASAAAAVVQCIVQSSHGWPYLIQRLAQDYLTASTCDDGSYAPAADWDVQRVLDGDPYTHRLLSER